jgi:hypothetical protein
MTSTRSQLVKAALRIAMAIAVPAALIGCGSSHGHKPVHQPVYLTNRDLGGANLKLGAQRSAVLRAFGPPVRTTHPPTPNVKLPAKAPNGRVIPTGPVTCDYYHHRMPSFPAAQQFAALCYRQGILTAVEVPAP